MIHGYGRVFTQSLWKGLKKTNAYGGKRHVCSDVIKGKTHVLFLHMGQPRSEYYAKEYLQKSNCSSYRYIPMVFLLNGKVKDSIAKYGEAGCIEEPLTTFTKRIQGSLNTIMPEFGSISCSTAFLFDDPSIDKENGYNHIVVFPLYPHYSCTRSGFLLNEIERVLQTFTVPATIDDREVPCERIVPNSSSSFHVSALHRWGNHPIVSEVRYVIGGVVFCAPSIVRFFIETYRRSVWSTCERIMAGLDDSFPWRLSFFNAWDQWDLPVVDSIKRLNSLIPPGKQIALVPVSSILPDFNTFSVLPNIATSLVSTMVAVGKHFNLSGLWSRKDSFIMVAK
ncbi:unnamed protein product [Haemonchus placei]|uniref:Exostosin domain-containing protein n=1 Tax=Haemonchus placei TaxID=6290 RepID=A0A0N4X2W4_HAEPC|nr:unnamed protein product [Haemonchus placei]